MDEELVEKVARAMYARDWPPETEANSWKLANKKPYLASARAAIQAMMDAGWKSPTEAEDERIGAYYEGQEVGRDEMRSLFLEYYPRHE